MDIKNRLDLATFKIHTQYTKVKNKIKEDIKGGEYTDTGIKILIAVVLGALLLAGLYALFDGTILPTLKRRIEEMFNYKG